MRVQISPDRWRAVVGTELAGVSLFLLLAEPANILCKTGKDDKISIKIADFGVCNVLGNKYYILY